MTETIKIDGMSCGGCVASVKRALERLPIASAQVEIGSATVEYDETAVNRAQMLDAIEDAGFQIHPNESEVA